MSEVKESQGIVLFSRDHREKDKLVKIFTERYGKTMFFVRDAHRKNNPLTSGIMPFTKATFIGDIRQEGLSFLNAAKEIVHYQRIQRDIFVNAYATYLMNLADAAIEDRIYDPSLYGFLRDSLEMLDQGMDPEVITNIFEIQILRRFGTQLELTKCCVCGSTKEPADFSSKYGGTLCPQHLSLDERRYHADPKAMHFIRLFAQIHYSEINSVTLSDETKASIRQVIDEIYNEFIGLHLKSKKFIDGMKSWEGAMKIPKRKEPD